MRYEISNNDLRITNNDEPITINQISAKRQSIKYPEWISGYMYLLILGLSVFLL